MLAIEVRNLTRIYKQRNTEDIVANDNITFSVERGDVFGLLGHNGAGKSTLLMQLMGLLAPTSGSLIVEGIDVTKRPDRVKKLVGFLPQGETPLRYVTLQNALHFAGRLKGLSTYDTRQQVNYFLDVLNLGVHASQYVNELSGGLLRMTNFAMALMGKPRLLILDEPTNDLDPARRRQMWQLLSDLNVDNGLTILLVTHNLAEAERVMQQAAIMENGTIIAQGTIGTIKQSLNQEILLEVWLKQARSLPETVRQQMQGRIEEVRIGHYRIYLQKHLAKTAINTLLEAVDFDELDDFHIAPLSLEEAYHRIEMMV